MVLEKENKLQVEAIKCGSVIDHIPARTGFKLLSLFKLAETDKRITIGLNLPSRALGKKDLIKLEDVFLSEEQANQLVLYAPSATINQIENYQVVHKFQLGLPERVDGIFNCPNNNCISRIEPVVSVFLVKQRSQQILLQCKYCEKEFERQAMIQLSIPQRPDKPTK